VAGPGGREAGDRMAFVMVLACPRHMFVRPVIRLDQQAWSECNLAAFGFFGGVPAGWSRITFRGT
jgi:transposase